MESSLVSVVIPCYNHEKFVIDCIQSVIDQTYQNIELIIIDDGSSDASISKIEEMIALCKERFTNFEFRHRSNQGLSSTLNEALDWCTGLYFCCLASDDQILKDKISYQVNYLNNNPNVVAIFGNVNLIDDNNNYIKSEKYPSKKYIFDDIILNKHHINACTQLLRINSIRTIGGYKSGIVLEDLYLWLKLCQIGEIYIDRQIFSNYRLHENNSIKRGQFIYKGGIEVLQEYYDHPLFYKAIKKVIWTYVISLAISDKTISRTYLRNLIFTNCIDLFSSDFIRYLRNYFFR